MTNCTPAPTPIYQRLSKPTSPPREEELKWQKATPYRALVGALLYLSCTTRPDISYAVHELSKNVADHRLLHWVAAKRVLRYLKGTADLGLHFTKAAEFNIKVFSDADFAGDESTRKSVSGFIAMACGAPLSCMAMCSTNLRCSLHLRGRTRCTRPRHH